MTRRRCGDTCRWLVLLFILSCARLLSLWHEAAHCSADVVRLFVILCCHCRSASGCARAAGCVERHQPAHASPRGSSCPTAVSKTTRCFAEKAIWRRRWWRVRQRRQPGTTRETVSPLWTSSHRRLLAMWSGISRGNRPRHQRHCRPCLILQPPCCARPLGA